MLLKSLTLKNIRSYVELQVEFPPGSLLLAGDIGSGKSTILLAIEFALFGLLRGDVDGAALLRNGSREGFVELVFSVDGQDYAVRRTLKRQKDKVAQEAGWLTHNGLRKDGTSQELKSWVLSLLGYPKDFLTKSKTLLFRYTVFTPQEEMKRILFEERDARLETLRRVFDVDKYRRIKENAAIYLRTVKEERRQLEGMSHDLESRRTALQLKQEEAAAVRRRGMNAKDALEGARQRTTAQREAVAKTEDAVRDAQRLRAELQVAHASVLHQEQTLQRALADQEKAQTQVRLLQEELQASAPVPLETVRQQLELKSSHVQELERVLRESHTAIAQISAGRSLSVELKQKVAALNTCPVCMQLVTLEHKNRISFAEDQKLRQLDDLLRRHHSAREQFENQLIALKQELDTVRRQEADALMAQAKRKALEERQGHVASVSQHVSQTQEKLVDLRKRRDELNTLVEASRAAEDSARQARQRLDALLAEERTAEVEHARLAKELEGTQAFIAQLQEDVRQKEQAKARLLQLSARQGWLSDHFSSLMDVMEKHVLARVHHEFNDLFQRWFSTLIEDELLAGRLDDTFTPVVTQNGYDVDIAHLSGGEKTACALAYRLALNRVINDVISTIRTKDVLILDEPTDGFSSEQLDKVRDVLEQLRLKQIIIVSHEAKIESMVDRVLRVQKDGHVSSVVNA